VNPSGSTSNERPRESPPFRAGRKSIRGLVHHAHGLRIGRARLPLPAAAEPHLGAGERVVVGIRPEYAALADDEGPGAIAGKVVLLESLGSAFLVSVEGDGVRAQVTVPEGRQPAVGDQAFLVPDAERLLVYRKDDGELVGGPGPAP
jgi:multiple sugar transport system ATP-binding protein